MRTSIEETYIKRTPGSEQLMQRAREYMPGGNTRSWTHFNPYPIVYSRADGAFLWDADGNRYIDVFYNGLSIIHGHRFEPIQRAIQEALDRGAPWQGASDKQVEFAEFLCRRIPSVERVFFTNSGTEAAMLAAKLARSITQRPLILKAWGAYHGTYEDFEAGLIGHKELPDRTLLAEFGNAESFERALAGNPGRVAAVFMEPVMYTESVLPPPPGFLHRVQAAAKEAGALFVIDDCLMFRLAEGGSQEKYDLQPDLTVLGKFIGAGVPVGVVGGPEKHMELLDPRRKGYVEHGGSYNGNLVGMAAGKVNLEHLTAEQISAMDRRTERLGDALAKKASAMGIPLCVPVAGSVMGLYFSERPAVPPRRNNNSGLQQQFRLACLNHGIAAGPNGQIALATMLDDSILEEVIAGFSAALEDVAPHAQQLTAQQRAV